MMPEMYEIRIHVRDITEHINLASEAGRKCLELCNGRAWEVWAYMPAFGAHYCSAERLTQSLFLGTVAQSQLTYPDGIADLSEDELETWRDDVDDAVRELASDTPPWEMFNITYALKNSFDFTLDYKGERWADYEDLEDAVKTHDKMYEAGRRRSALYQEREAIHKAVEVILEQAREHYNRNCLTDAVRQFQKV